MNKDGDDNNSFRKLLAQSNMIFDYEVNNVKFEEDKKSQNKSGSNKTLYFLDKIQADNTNFSKH